MSSYAARWRPWWDANDLSATDPDPLQLRVWRRFPFLLLARKAQRPPPGRWRTWLFVGGRGAGKTRAGAEWTRYAALYAQGQVAHVGRFDVLEDEMCRFGTDGMVRSPDRVDALVWAVTSLMLTAQGVPRIRAL